MENKITGQRPQPVTDEETITFEDNPAAQELCEQVNQLTAEVREALLQQALAVSNEKCNSLISRLNALTEELTRQVKSVKLRTNELEWNLKDDNGKMLKDLKESNRHLTDSLTKVLREMREVTAQIQAEISIATAKATDEAATLLNNRINEATEKAIRKIDEETEEITKKLKAAEMEVGRIKDDIRFERGFRKFLFWATPVLLLAQTIISVFLLLN